jgi:lipoprotein-releasing system ATP-binding protein
MNNGALDAITGDTVASSGGPVLRLSNIHHTFGEGRRRLEILTGVDLEVMPGEIVALVGPSGAGKSTLLHIAGLLETPDAGEIAISGEQCQGLGDNARTMVRRKNLGFVYQYHHLLAEFSALENITIPQIIAGYTRKEARLRATEILAWMGISERAAHRPAKLSGGEQQRVAIGRAIAAGPSLLLADEPTGNLDPDTASDVFAVLLKLVRGAGMAALVATHNPDLANRMDRIVKVEAGKLVAG